MEEMEFVESRMNLGALEKDYEETAADDSISSNNDSAP